MPPSDTVAVAVCVYCMYFGFTQHACARLSIAKSKIHQPFNNLDHNHNVLEVPIDLSDWIIDIIQHLARTTEFIKLISYA
ncbi:hypothetical protein KPH14_000843 [Odynerus spinipes]|uniref:Uncharacterized protein n=1 Tax=Odynerus spinipes TaxID=1348599 RepID=A0AAD9VKN0_9HYME|nr:hypothetical protein KPH14_000843 [Odynerus spinipes]